MPLIEADGVSHRGGTAVWNLQTGETLTMRCNTVDGAIFRQKSFLAVERLGGYYHQGMKAVVSEKGQVTIPKQLRQRLGIEPGSELEFSDENGRLVARKVSRRDPVDGVYGIVDLGRPTDEVIDALRGPADLP